jgi:hypothetical protein
MSKQPPTKAPEGNNDTTAHSVPRRRHDSASSMYANPDTDPTYQQDPVIGRDANGVGSLSQTSGRNHHESGFQSTRPSK